MFVGLSYLCNWIGHLYWYHVLGVLWWNLFQLLRMDSAVNIGKEERFCQKDAFNLEPIKQGQWKSQGFVSVAESWGGIQLIQLQVLSSQFTALDHIGSSGYWHRCLSYQDLWDFTNSFGHDSGYIGLIFETVFKNRKRFCIMSQRLFFSMLEL